MTETIEAVSQAARDAAHAAHEAVGTTLLMDSIRRGQDDSDDLVQIFARFERDRIAAYTKTLIEEAVELGEDARDSAETLRAFPDGNHMTGGKIGIVGAKVLDHAAQVLIQTAATIAVLKEENDLLQKYKKALNPLYDVIKNLFREYGSDRPDGQLQPLMLSMSDVKRIAEVLGIRFNT